MKWRVLMYMILLSTRIACAQLYDKTWVCGTYAGTLTFTTDTTEIVNFLPFVHALSQWASICNAEGELQLFTEGVNIYASDGTKMPNGTQLADNEVNSDFPNGLPDDQNVLILPKTYKEFYVIYQSQSDFAYANEPWHYTDNLYYSIVDMEQQNGKGDVVQKRVLVNNNRFMDGKMTACQHANGRDWWLVQRRYNTNGYFIYLVTAEGITLQREQFIGAVSQEPDRIGQSAFSPDGSKYATITGKSPLIVLDFDRCEGIFSNPHKVHIPMDTFPFYNQTGIFGGGAMAYVFPLTTGLSISIPSSFLGNMIYLKAQLIVANKPFSFGPTAMSFMVSSTRCNWVQMEKFILQTGRAVLIIYMR